MQEKTGQSASKSKAASSNDLEPELYAGAPLFAATATLCLLALARIF